jgi:hypothetical protein
MGVWLQRQRVCWPFLLLFMKSITTTGVHNMLALMLELRFKRLKCVIDFLGHDKAKLLVVKYDNKILIPLLVKCSHFLNLDVAITCTLTSNGQSNSFFDTPIFGTNVNNFIFFHCVVNLIDDARSPLIW